jgi:radical SAM superfamily enzyme with C-terminal helix-hairpin-helix motif
VSPYPRLAAGVLTLAGLAVRYVTIDQWREDDESRETLRTLGPDSLLVIVAGLTVPGHYRGGTPISLNELRTVLAEAGGRKVVGGPIRHGYTLTGGTAAMPVERMWLNMLAVTGDHECKRQSAKCKVQNGQASWLSATITDDCRSSRSCLDAPTPRLADARSGEAVVRGGLEAWLADLLRGEEDPIPRFASFAEQAPWAVAGAAVVQQHPRFPNVIAEIETARGCERTRHCSFCTEGLLPEAHFRDADDILAEVAALYGAGLRHFRLGKQPNFFAWPGRRGHDGLVRPDPAAVETLYRGIRALAPDLATLHIDNVNPGFLANYPDQCLRIAETIAALNTPGDVAAMGVESVDDALRQAHGLKATAAEALAAIRLVNRAGSGRQGRSLPALLPGLNFLCGLPGETAATYQRNLDFLKTVLDEGLMLRRINVRQVMAFPETPLGAMLDGRPPKVDKRRFHRWKQRVSDEVERPMLERVAPRGTILRHVVIEYRDGDVSFGRQLASYPLLVGFPYPLEPGAVLDAFVVDHGYRSVTALPYPLDLNSAPEKALAALPGIGRPRARRLIEARPAASVDTFRSALDSPSVLDPWLDYLVAGLHVTSGRGP